MIGGRRIRLKRVASIDDIEDVERLDNENKLRLRAAEGDNERTIADLNKSFPGLKAREESLVGVESPPNFRRLKWSDPGLGTLGTLPNEIITEILKQSIPAEIPEMILEGDSELFSLRARENPIDFMRASSKLYGITRELWTFKQRTYHFAVSGLGYSFEGHRNCPLRIIKGAMNHVEWVQIDVEIDLAQMNSKSYTYGIVDACCMIFIAMKHLNGSRKRLEGYHIQVKVIDSEFGHKDHTSFDPTNAFGPHNSLYGHHCVVNGVLLESLERLIEIQNIRYGGVRLLSLPLSRHPLYDCSENAATPELGQDARDRWHQLQGMADAAAYLLSGYDIGELEWCARYLYLEDWTSYRVRIECMETLEPPGSQPPPVYDSAVKKRCRCEKGCLMLQG